MPISSGPGIYPEEGGLAGPLGPSRPWEPDAAPAPTPGPYDGLSGSGTAESSIWDDLRPDAATTSVLESGSNLLGLIPGVSTVMSIGSMAYHGGSAIYDGLHGDRDGAIAHGTQALMSGVGAIPMVGDAIGSIDAGIAAGSTQLRAMAPGMGVDPSQIPSSIGDIAAFTAVAGTNAIFGADDSNWIADGDTPTGTRGGEIQAGADMLGYALGGPIFGEDIGGYLKPLVTGAGEFFGSDLAAPTSGRRDANGNGSYAQELGDIIHNAPGIVADSFKPPSTEPINVPVSGPTLPVPPDDLLY